MLKRFKARWNFSIESATTNVPDHERILDITFPPSEIESLKPRTTIITHRVSDDAEKFQTGDLVYAEAIDDNYCFEVVERKVISKIEDSPYYKDLTNGQRTFLSKFDKIAVLILKKSKYERPYKLSTIKAKYPEKVYKLLVANACHAWRAKTGIDMIHLEPDDAEQARTCKNWRLMPEKYRKISDQKSKELFGCDNLGHEKMLTVDRCKKLFSIITYGLRDPKTNKPWKETHKSTTGQDYDEFWRLGSPEETIAAKVGNCYDTVAISREYLSKAGIKFITYFMTTADSKFDGEHFTEAPTHTFLLYQSKADNMWYWLEGSWGPFKNNNFRELTPSNLIKSVATAMANMESKAIIVYELLSYPKYGCDMTEFEGFCRKGKVVGTYQPEHK